MSYRAGRMAVIAFAVILSMLSLSCSPEVGSDSWCEKMKDTPKGDWSANETADFAKHCLFR